MLICSQNTALRRKRLKQEKHFKCECLRCKDPYELGSNMSTIKCPKCKFHTMTMVDSLSDTLSAEQHNWKCKNCQKTLSGRVVERAIQIAETKVHLSQDESIKVS